jgi:hypothetical protein
MAQEKILTSPNMDSLPNVPPAHQESELREFMAVREQRRKPPKINVKSVPGKPLSIEYGTLMQSASCPRSVRPTQASPI